METAAITAWLLDPATGRLDHGAFIGGLCDRIVAAGVSLGRASMSLRSRHPESYVISGVWRPDTGGESITRPRSLSESALYRDSPIYRIHHEGRSIRLDLTVPEDQIPYPICRELKAEGMTDYLIQPMFSSHGGTSFASWTTKRPSGFTPAEIGLFEAIAPALALRMDANSAHLATSQLLQVYLGANAARRVLDGAVERGSGERITAAIWFCDLRGFTRLSDRSEVTDVIEVLDRYFGLVAGPIERHGGEILKFIGDAVLAVFPTRDDSFRACTCALVAAREALEAGRSLPEGLRFGIALHVGEVFYGNIGASNRLDFTVIGPAVNEASRVEGMCKQLGQDLLLTGVFAEHCDPALLQSLGEHALRGVEQPQELFTLAPPAPS